MYSLDSFFEFLDSYAPLEISRKMIEKGDYDNSGILIKCSDTVKKVLFSLDLSILAVEEAVKNGCDTIVTHHPAIYHPIKSLGTDISTKAVLLAVENKINVISMHLNLDMAKKGIDYYLAKGLRANDDKILDLLQDGVGYGRTFDKDCSLEQFVQSIKKEFNTDKIIYYGQGSVKKVASFCGGGASYALDYVSKNLISVDTIVTSDMPHHVIKELIEEQKNIVLIPHYVSEEYGFSKFYAHVSSSLKGEITAYYLDDKRFR